jgi:cbb3-type cytochrome oxidase subunit 3
VHALLAQHAQNDAGGETAMTIMLVAVLVLIWTLLGVVCWIFWRAKRREDDRQRRLAEWRNAHSS